MICPTRTRLLAVFAVWALLCVAGQEFLGAMHTLTCCAPACCEVEDESQGGGAPADDNHGCSHAYCCHTSVAVADGSAEHLDFQPLIVTHEWNDAACAAEVPPVGIEHPPQLG